VAQSAEMQDPLGRVSAVLADNGLRLVAAAVALLSVGIFLLPQHLGLAAFGSGAALATLAGLGQAVALRRLMAARAAVREVAALSDHDPTPCLVTGPEGEVRYLNAAARKRFRSAEGTTLARALGDLFANPSGVLFRLQEKAAALGGAREDVVTRRGHVRLTVVDLSGEGFLWRFDEVAEARSPARGAESLSLPMLTATATGAILFMNEALRRVLGGRVKHLDRVITDLPLRPGDVHEIAAEGGPLSARVAEVPGPGGRRELYFLPAEPGARSASTAARVDFEDLPVALLELAPDGVILAANRLARGLIGCGGPELAAGLVLADRLEGLGRPLRDWLAEAAQGRGLGRSEVLRVRDADPQTYLQVTLGRSGGEGEVRLTAVLNDVTELKTLEAQVVQSQKMQAIGQLAGGVAHDFNNILTAISGHCDLLLLRHDPGDPDYADLVQIHQNANRAAALVSQLLAFSRKQTMQPEVFDLRDTLSDLTHLLNRLVGEKVTLRLRHDAVLPPIRGDRRQIEQVIMNLVVNARDAMPDGGEVLVETQARTLAEDLHRDRAVVPAGDYVVVKVEDHGVGIPPDRLQKIFEPFYTTKRVGEGTGLGLSTAYGIVKQCGGFIFVDSLVGVGSVFTLYFPAVEAAEGREASSRPAEVGALLDRVIGDAALGGITAAGRANLLAPAKPRRAGGSTTQVMARDGAAVAGRPGRSGTGLGKGAAVAASAPVSGAAPASAAVPAGDAAADAIPPVLEPSVAEGAVAAAAVAEAPSAPVATGVAAGGSVSDAGSCDRAVPVAAGSPGPAPKAEAGELHRPAPRGGEGVVLLVEDEAPVRAFASRALRMRGYTVIEAADAEEALETLEDPTLRVDVFVTDVVMPGMDGPTWVRKALEKRPSVKVVFVSGYAEETLGDDHPRIPNAVFLAKPFSLSELTATVQTQVH
jgi:two-component system cell cycle sensor histidine kinase/response regulator CckA